MNIVLKVFILARKQEKQEKPIKRTQIVYSVQCTVYSVQCTVYSVQCTRRTVYNVPSPRYTELVRLIRTELY